MSLLGIGASLLGGILGSRGSSSSQTTNQIDPRLAPYVYGADGKGGLLGDVQTLYRQQMGQGGLNDMQRAGMESMRQVYASPQYTQGYDAMRSMGLGLMGGGIAGNPFASGGMPQGSPSVVRPTTNMQYSPFQYQQTGALSAMNTPIPSVQEYRAQQPQQPSQQTIDQMIEDYMRRMGLGRYADSARDGAGSGEMADYGGFDGGMLGLLGLDGGFNDGLASVGGDVAMGSAAGNGGDNGAETGSDAGFGDGNGGDLGANFAKGGKVTKKRLTGPNPKGPDDGYAALDEGEYVIKAKAAKRIGYDKLHKMNKRG